MTKNKNKKKNKKIKLSSSSRSNSSDSSSCNSSGYSNTGASSPSNKNNNINKSNSRMAHASTGVSCSTPKSTFATPNRFDPLYEDANASLNSSRRSLPPLPTERQQLPTIPDIPGLDQLNETQKKSILISLAEKMGVEHPAPPPTPRSQQNPMEADPATAASRPLRTHAAPEVPSQDANTTKANGTPSSRSMSAHQSRKRKRVGEVEAVDQNGKQISSNGNKVESVFLTGVNKEITKNGIVFQKAFESAVPNIKVNRANITRSGCVILSPATPEDFSRLMKEDWSKHVSLGSAISASLPKSKKLEYKVVVTGVDPDLDDDTLKAELESRNDLKITGLARLHNKETRAKIFKVIICLESEEIQKRLLRSGVFLGFQHHKCVEAHDGGRVASTENVNQCFRCQRWNPNHTSSQCKERRACVWCAGDHFHRDCTHFQNRDKEHAKCANCNEAHPSWSHSCVAFNTASKTATKTTAAKIVGSSSVSKSEVETALAAAMSELWMHLANIVSVVVSRAVLDLEAEIRKPKVNKGELVLKATANTVRAIKDCGLLHPNRQIEVTDVQQHVWKDIFPQTPFPNISQACSTPLNHYVSQSK